MTDKLKKSIEELSLRIRLFIETVGHGISEDVISERELNFLEYLNEKKNPGFSEICSFFNKISPSTASNTLKKLHLQGLVDRREDPNNLKTKSFSLTENGRQALKPIQKNQADLLLDIIEALHLTKDEAETATNIIRRAITNFDVWLGFADTPDSDDMSVKDTRIKTLTD